jgi:putative addiction module component (TIGR02574 family)
MPPLRLKCPSPPVLPAWPVVNDLLTLPLAQRLELVQTLWDSIAAEQNGPELTDADRQLIDQRLESFLADGDPVSMPMRRSIPSSSRSEQGAATPPSSPR